jgi:hypothetical protein
MTTALVLIFILAYASMPSSIRSRIVYLMQAELLHG